MWISCVLPLQSLVLWLKSVDVLPGVVMILFYDWFSGFVPSPLQLVEIPEEVVVLFLEAVLLVPLVPEELFVFPLHFCQFLHLGDWEIVECLFLLNDQLIKLCFSLLPGSFVGICQLDSMLILYFLNPGLMIFLTLNLLIIQHLNLLGIVPLQPLNLHLQLFDVLSA